MSSCTSKLGSIPPALHQASSPSAMFRHGALASVGCPSPPSSFCTCQFRLHYTAGGSVAFVSVACGAPTCPNEMIRYDKNIQPMPVFDSLMFLYQFFMHLYARPLLVGLFWIVPVDRLSHEPTLRQGSPHWLWALLAAIFGLAKAWPKCGGYWLD